MPNISEEEVSRLLDMPRRLKLHVTWLDKYDRSVGSRTSEVQDDLRWLADLIPRLATDKP